MTDVEYFLFGAGMALALRILYAIALTIEQKIESKNERISSRLR